jgi:hypothetical protein
MKWSRISSYINSCLSRYRKKHPGASKSRTNLPCLKIPSSVAISNHVFCDNKDISL